MLARYRLFATVGRNRERQRLYDASQLTEPVLLCGPPGIGKTRLLLDLKTELEAEGSAVSYIRFTHPLHDFLVSLTGALQLNASGSLGDATSITLRGVIWKRLEGSPRAILLDDIIDAGPQTYRFFERLLSIKGVTLIGSAVHQHSLGSLHRIFWDQRSIITLKPLNRAESEEVADLAIRAFVPSIQDAADFRRQVLNAARGNPGRIVDMCRLAADPAYRSGERVLFSAINIDSLTTLIR